MPVSSVGRPPCWGAEIELDELIFAFQQQRGEVGRGPLRCAPRQAQPTTNEIPLATMAVESAQPVPPPRRTSQQEWNPERQRAPSGQKDGLWQDHAGAF
jgi:hypothetical protein